MFLFPAQATHPMTQNMPKTQKKVIDKSLGLESWFWGLRALLTFYRGGEDDEIVIEELPILNKGKAGVIGGLECEFKAPVWTRRKQGAEADGMQRETTAAGITTALPNPHPKRQADLGGPLMANEWEGG